MNLDFSPGRVVMFLVFSVLLIVMAFVDFGQRPSYEFSSDSTLFWVLFLEVGLFILCFYISEEQRVAKAKADAEIAHLKQQQRFAESDTPIDVKSQIAVMTAQADLKWIEAEIAIWTAKENAAKVLEFTKKKHDLEKQLGRLQ